MTTLPRNSKLFALFRVFFNCRFYYPIYFVMFQRFGLNIVEFATLNLIWAIAIVLLEVPSGALADQLGRKRLVVLAGVLMVAEIGILLAIDPAWGKGLVFGLFVLNRVLSGAAEAAASGADEALAYDSIPEDSREHLWRRTMKWVMIGMSVGFIITSIIGAAVFDPNFVNGVLARCGIDLELTAAQTLKLPLVLNLLTAVATLVIALRFEEPPGRRGGGERGLAAVRESFAGTFRAGRWILASPAATALMLIGLSYDSLIRLYYTVSSNVYLLLRLPEAVWGFVGAGASLIGIGAALLCERMAARWSASANFAFVTMLTFLGCLALANPVPLWGVFLLLPMLTAMRFLQYFLSLYLNQVIPSEQRATVLSFKGVSMNLAYGCLTQLFGVLAARLGESGRFDAAPDPDLAAFAYALTWWPGYFAVGSAVLFIGLRLRYRKGLSQLIAEGRAANSPAGAGGGLAPG